MSPPAAPGPQPGGNPLKIRLARGEYVLGATVSVPSIEVAAQVAALGFDFLWIEMEHSPITLETLRAMVLATRGLPAVPLVRIPAVETWMAKRVLDSGALGVIFPFVGSPVMAQLASEACRYPPQGRRGAGEALAHFRWPTVNYYDFADKNVLCVVMVEDAEAVGRIDQIAATPGVDVIFIGVTDLSFSLGLRGRQDEPLLKEAAAKVIAAARRHGKYLGRPALDPESVARFHSEGFQFFQGPTDVNLLRQGIRGLLHPIGRFRPPNSPDSVL